MSEQLEGMCGIGLDEDGDITPIICMNDDMEGTKLLAVSGCSYDVMCLCGFKDVEFEIMEEEGKKYRELTELFKRQARGAGVAYVLIKEGLMVIKDYDEFSAVIQPRKACIDRGESYKGYVDYMDVSEVTDILERLTKISKIIG